MMTALDIHETTQLEAHEKVIERGMKAFAEVGQALLAIRDAGLYKASHATFEAYCQERWGISQAGSYRMMEAATVLGSSPMGELVRAGELPAPANERQLRPLTKLSPEDQPKAWREAVETAPGGKVTAAHVEQVAEKFLQKDSELASDGPELGSFARGLELDALTYSHQLAKLLADFGVWNRATGRHDGYKGGEFSKPELWDVWRERYGFDEPTAKLWWSNLEGNKLIWRGGHVWQLTARGRDLLRPVPAAQSNPGIPEQISLFAEPEVTMSLRGSSYGQTHDAIRASILAGRTKAECLQAADMGSPTWVEMAWDELKACGCILRSEQGWKWDEAIYKAAGGLFPLVGKVHYDQPHVEIIKRLLADFGGRTENGSYEGGEITKAVTVSAWRDRERVSLRVALDWWTYLETRELIHKRFMKWVRTRRGDDYFDDKPAAESPTAPAFVCEKCGDSLGVCLECNEFTLCAGCETDCPCQEREVEAELESKALSAEDAFLVAAQALRKAVRGANYGWPILVTNLDTAAAKASKEEQAAYFGFALGTVAKQMRREMDEVLALFDAAAAAKTEAGL